MDTKYNKETGACGKLAKGLLALLAASCVSLASAHGDVVPQEVDVKTLQPLGEEWLEANPYNGNQEAIRVGDSAYNLNCARCHGLGAVSGGIAPDLRYLPIDEEGDEIFIQRIRNGYSREGRVYMPPFEGIIPQEAMWAIRAWLVTVSEQ